MARTEASVDNWVRGSGRRTTRLCAAAKDTTGKRRKSTSLRGTGCNLSRMRLFPEGQGGPVQRQLVGLFIDGLAHDYLKMKVMRENPMESERAVGIATEDQNVRQKFALRTRFRGDADRPIHKGRMHASREPMKVDHSRGRVCHHCRGNHKAKGYRQRKMEVQGIVDKE